MYRTIRMQGGNCPVPPAASEQIGQTGLDLLRKVRAFRAALRFEALGLTTGPRVANCLRGVETWMKVARSTTMQ